jgi:hypothetical protein
MKRTLFVATLALVATSIAAAPAVLAQYPNAPTQGARDGVAAEIILLHGTNNGTGIDPRLGRIPALSRPPFSSFNSYDLLRRESLSLSRVQPATTKLPNRSDLVVSYQGTLNGPKAGDPKKHVVSLSIQRQGSMILPLLQVNANAGETLFAAVPGYKGGVLVIGIKVTP